MFKLSYFNSLVRQDLGRETCEVFYRKVNLWDGDPPPSFVSLNLIFEMFIEYRGSELLLYQEIWYLFCGNY